MFMHAINNVYRWPEFAKLSGEECGRRRPNCGAKKPNESNKGRTRRAILPAARRIAQRRSRDPINLRLDLGAAARVSKTAIMAERRWRLPGPFALARWPVHTPRRKAKAAMAAQIGQSVFLRRLGRPRAKKHVVRSAAR
ncbi:hypothetical protein SKAU_G00402790 [Synaphobranchus kaupii]|uniref:Uncharacterized protein n=1 Tax=Synaphobranchus kaupii TaxID=118154 RepID=A0A9Q1E9F6_SYNKA|nr:hypothetical protein SKAU_G00402790 [Synaphobranchus kaupii]